jgi:hypothetical protein
MSNLIRRCAGDVLLVLTEETPQDRAKRIVNRARSGRRRTCNATARG